MAGGMAITSSKRYAGRLTKYVIFTAIVASSGGAIFGYDIGISGGVTSMDTFLGKFFPEVLRDRSDRNAYCRYNNQRLQLFTSSLYLAGLVSTFFASYTSSVWGRRPTMLIGGLSFCTGAILNGFAKNLIMLIFGRIMLGIGVGFANQSVPIYLSEIAPSKWRGRFNILFQLSTTLGILVANLINWKTEKLKWGWRLSLGLAFVPASILTLGGLFLPESPNSLIERVKYEEGKAQLEKIRGIPNVEEEFNDIVTASDTAQRIKNPFNNLLRREHRPQLSVAFFIPFFQQLTGINTVMFYAPVLFRTIGFKSNAALFSAVITGTVMLIATLLSMVLVDRFGRKILFFSGGVIMLISQIPIGIIMKYKLPLDIDATISQSWAYVVVALICSFVAAFAWSWGPLGWLLPSEVFPLEIRSAGQSVTVFTNFLFTFFIGQAFLTMLCSFKWGFYLFFAAFVVMMTSYVFFLLPETEGVPIEEMKDVWAKHRYWKKYAGGEKLPVVS